MSTQLLQLSLLCLVMFPRIPIARCSYSVYRAPERHIKVQRASSSSNMIGSLAMVTKMREDQDSETTRLRSEKENGSGTFFFR
jgi:hypothetical protein